MSRQWKLTRISSESSSGQMCRSRSQMDRLVVTSAEALRTAGALSVAVCNEVLDTVVAKHMTACLQNSISNVCVADRADGDFLLFSLAVVLRW